MILDVYKKYHTLCHKPMSSLDVTCNVTYNVKNAKFCPGPCKCTDPEPKPIVIKGVKHHVFKPYSGNHYISYSYPMLNGGILTLEDVRMCVGCNDRYLDLIDDSESEEAMLRMLDMDAKAIIDKLEMRT